MSSKRASAIATHIRRIRRPGLIGLVVLSSSLLLGAPERANDGGEKSPQNPAGTSPAARHAAAACP